MTRACAVVTAALALSGCLRAVPLTGDPMMPARDAHLSPPQLYKVEWWSPLVNPGLLEFQPSETAAPAIDPDTEDVFVGTRDGHFRCVSKLDGAVRWDKKFGGRMFAGAAVRDGVVYVPSGDGVLRALKAGTGEQLWDYSPGEELVTTPVLAGGKALLVSQSDTLFAVDAETGKWVWQYRRDLPSGFTVRGAGQPLVEGDRVYQGFSDGTVVALGLDDGVSRWEKRVTTSGGSQFLDVDSTPVLEHGVLYVASYKDGVAALDAATGDLKWFTARPGVTSLLPRGDVLFTSGDGQVAGVQASTGKVLWTLELSEKGGKKGSNSGRGPLLTKSYLLVPTSTALVFVDPSTGTPKMAWNPGRGISATPARLGSRLYVLSNLGDLFALHLTGGG